MFRTMLRRALGLAMGVLVSATPACRSPALEKGEPREPSPSEVLRKWERSRFLSTEPLTIRTPEGKIIFYPVKTGRAEDWAATLLPIAQAEHGPDARVVPHVQTNQLMIYLPDRRGEETTRPPRSVPGR